jgi:4-hydroxybenzoate polyprenyltransferase
MLVSLKRFLWIFMVVAVLLSPFFATGCGSDDTEQDKKIGIYTVGPGNLDAPNPNIKGN